MSPVSLAAEKRGEGGSLALTSKKEGGGDFFVPLRVVSMQRRRRSLHLPKKKRSLSVFWEDLPSFSCFFEKDSSRIWLCGK